MTEKNRKVFETFPDTVYLGKIPRKGSRRGWLLRIITVAAAMLSIPLGIYAVMDMLSDSGHSPDLVVEGISARSYSVNNGVKGKVMLPDSTTVWLNSGSTLILADDFEERRQVSLEGEGYFKVRSDKDNPFYICTGKDVTVKVTGTEFNLCCYKEQQDVRLTLLSGSVELMQGMKTIYRMNGKEEVSVKEGSVNESTNDIKEAIAWTTGSLMFENTPMKDVIARMERWYGVHMIVEDMRIYNSSFTGDFRSESIDQVLELLSLTSGFRYTINGTEIRLSL